MTTEPPDSDVRLLLESLPLFRGMKPEWLDMIAPLGYFTTVERGHFITREGQEATHFFVIREGAAAIELNSGLSGPVTIEHLSADDIVGWSTFQHPYRWSLTTLATEDCRLLTFDAHALRHLCHDHTDLGYFMMLQIIQVVVHRLEAARMQLLDFYS